jgi:hypothetical protein
MEILNENWSGTKYYIRAKIVVDPSEVSKRANEVLLNQKEMKILQDKNQEILRQVDKLNSELSRLRNQMQSNENFLFAEINEYKMQVNDLLGQITQLRRINSEISTKHKSELFQRDSIINSLNLQIAELKSLQKNVREESRTVSQAAENRDIKVQDEITITTTPVGALVYADEKYMGKTPYSYKNAPHTKIAIRVKPSGFDSHTWNINYSGGKMSLDKSFGTHETPVKEVSKPVQEGISTITRQEIISDECLVVVDAGGVDDYLNISFNKIFVTRMNPHGKQNFVLKNGSHTIYVSRIRKDGSKWKTVNEKIVSFKISQESTAVFKNILNDIKIETVPGKQFVTGSIIRVR